jgi:hypothetical protein
VAIFNRPLQFTYRYETGPAPRLMYWDGQNWINLQTSANPATGLAFTSSPHLTLVAAFVPAPEPPPAATGSPEATLAVVLFGIIVVAAATAYARRRLEPAAEDALVEVSTPKEATAPGALPESAGKRTTGTEVSVTAVGERRPAAERQGPGPHPKRAAAAALTTRTKRSRPVSSDAGTKKRQASRTDSGEETKPATKVRLKARRGGSPPPPRTPKK